MEYQNTQQPKSEIIEISSDEDTGEWAICNQNDKQEIMNIMVKATVHKRCYKHMVDQQITVKKCKTHSSRLSKRSKHTKPAPFLFTQRHSDYFKYIRKQLYPQKREIRYWESWDKAFLNKKCNWGKEGEMVKLMIAQGKYTKRAMMAVRRRATRCTDCSQKWLKFFNSSVDQLQD